MNNMITLRTTSMLLLGVIGAGISGACGDTKPLPACTDGVDCIYYFSCDNAGNIYWEWQNNDPLPDTPVSVSEPRFDMCEIIDPNDPNWEDQARAFCSARCEYLDIDTIPPANMEVCEDSNWSNVYFNSDDAAGAIIRCPTKTATLDLGPIIQFLGALAGQHAADLPCDLSDSCMDLLNQEQKKALSHPPTPNVGDSADVEMVHNPTYVSTITIINQSSAATGQAAYSAISCGEDACPFYLAQLDLEASSPMTVRLTYQGQRLAKTVSNATVSLEHPTLGMWLPSSGDVIFPPGALTTRVTGTVSGSTNSFGENGYHDFVYQPHDYVFGALDGGVFMIAGQGQDVLGMWGFDAQFVPN